MKIEVNAEFLFELKNKEEWIIKVPKILPKKVRVGESWVWLDKNGSVFELGRDFEAADKLVKIQVLDSLFDILKTPFEEQVDKIQCACFKSKGSVFTMTVKIEKAEE